MQTKTMLHLLGASLLSAVLASCGGSSGSSALNGGSGGSGGSGNTPAWLMGSGSGGGFNSGVLGVVYKSGISNLYVGDSALVTVSVVDGSQKVLATNEVAVTFSSPCLDSGKASIVGGKVVKVKGGQATVEYVPSTCTGLDTIKATASYGGVSLSATKAVSVRSIRLGVGSGVDFVPTKLSLDANAQALFSNQTTNISVNLVNDTGSLVEASFPVTFSSACISAGRSSVTGGVTVNSLGGVAKGEYKVGSCFGDDVVSASIEYAGQTITASAVLPQVNNRRIGSGSGSAFLEGSIAVGSTNTVFFEGDQIPLTVSLVDNQGGLVSQSTQVIFDSPCITSGKSVVAGSNIVNSIGGQATIQYKVGKCDSDDVVTATITNGDQQVQATALLAVDNRRMGSGFGSSYIDGALELGVGAGVLSPGASTAITAYIVNSKGELATDAINVTFSSPCLSADNASIAGGNTVTAVNGKAVATYTSKGCAGVGGFDAIKASATFRKTVMNATAQLAVKADSAQTIMFVDATPSLISLKGTGGAETSIVRFKVLGQGGSPLKGICVTFASSTSVGGLALVPSKCNPAGVETYGATSDINGFVSTTVQSGTVATPVRVTATTANGLSTQSSALAVTTGIPDQNSFSISLSDFAPIAWNFDGIETKATVRLADAFNNPVPDNTVVTFTTSGGSIDASCATAGGACTAVWRSQNPRPVSSNQVSFSTTPPFTKTCPPNQDSGGNNVSDCRSGRVKILATAIGNESFIDGNGNGVYDDKGVDVFATHNIANTSDINRAACALNMPRSSASVGSTLGCDDLSEAYVDKDLNGFRGNVEEFVDFNQNGLFDSNNGKYDGALCSGAAKANGDCTTNKVNIRNDATFVMSCTTPFIQGGTLPGLPASSVTMNPQDVKRFDFLVADCNGNGMPAGTKVNVKTDSLKNATASVVPSAAFGMSTEPTSATVIVTADAINDPVGTLVIEVVSPSSSGSVSTIFTVTVL